MTAVSNTPFSTRASLPNTHPLNAYLYHLISIKRSNLCVSADVYTASSLLQLAEEVGDKICILKTHADTIDDFSSKTIKSLCEISRRKKFLIFEDRKFCDIGNTVQAQYTRGQLRIATWAHLVNCSLISGTSIIPALASAASSTLSSINQSVSTEISVGTPRTSAELNDAVHDYPFPSSDAESSGKGKSAISGSLLEELEEPQRRGSVVHATTTISQKIERSLRSTSSLARAVSVGEGDETDREEALLALGEPPQDRGLLLLSEMSSEGNLMGKDYTAQCVEAARENNGFVIGHVAQRGLNEDLEKDNFVVLTPGVGLPKAGQKEDKFGKGDGLGQKYRTPEVVVKMGTDIIIVGRGILTAEDWAVEAERYRKAAWTAYESRVGRGDF